MKLLIAVILFPLALLVAIPAHATPPTLVTITSYSGPATVITSRTVDGITIETFTQSISFTEGFQGTSVQTFTLIVDSTGQYTVHGKGLFTGTVNGSPPGTAMYVFSATGTFNPYLQQGHVTIGRGTDGLAGLHSEAAYQQLSPTVTTMSVPIHFDPA